jgi:hypothetical protein
VADGWFVLREEYCWLVAGGWFVLREKYCWLVADKPSEQAARKLERTRRMIPRIRIMWPVLPQYSAEREKGVLGVMGCICFQELH